MPTLSRTRSRARSRTLIWSLALLATASAPMARLAAQGIPAHHPPLEPTTAQLERLRTKYNEAYNKKDPAAVAALYTADAILIGRNGAIVQGKPAIEQAMRQQSGSWGTISSKGVDTQRHGEWGWQVGSSTEMHNGGNNSAAEAASYLVILGKERGVWKIRALVAVPDSAGTARMRASR